MLLVNANLVKLQLYTPTIKNHYCIPFVWLFLFLSQSNGWLEMGFQQQQLSEIYSNKNMNLNFYWKKTPHNALVS